MRTVASVLVVVLVATLALVGCANEEPEEKIEKKGGDDGNLTVAFVPKAKNVSYYDEMHQGGKRAGFHQGFNWIYRPPEAPDVKAQIQTVRSLIKQRIDVIMVAPIDPKALTPVLDDARKEGIRVGTVDTDAPDSERQVFVSQVTPEAMGEDLTEQLMRATGGGEYAIVSCEEHAPDLTSWIEAQRAYAREHYPNAKLVDVAYAGSSESDAVAEANRIVAEHPKLTGMIGMCATAAPAVARAVKYADRVGQIHTVGVGAPKEMTPYFEDGSATASVIWDARRFGALTGWTGKQLAYKKEFEPVNRVNKNLTDVRYDADEETLLLGAPLVVSEKNADEYDF